MDMKVSSDQIRAYVTAQSKIAKQSLPEESRRVVLRLPTDSVEISPQSRALQKGRLRVQIDDDGSYARVTDDNSNPMMQLFDKGMGDVKQTLDKMRELTELMEDEGMSVEDRYATQMELVELEGELEKKIYELNEKYIELAAKLNLPMVDATTWAAEGQPGVEQFAKAGTVRDILEEHYLYDRVSGGVLAYKKFSDMIDKRTELRKEAIERVYMREHDPEAFAEYEEKLREALRKEYEDMRDENGLMPFYNGPFAVSEPIVDAEMRDATFPTNKFGDAEEGMLVPGTETGVDLSGAGLAPPSGEAADIVVPIAPQIDYNELAIEKYIEERLAEIEKGDYEEFNAMRVSVASASLAKESGNFLEKLTNQLTEQFQRFAAQNELIGEEDPSPESAIVLNRQGKIATIAKETLRFLRDTLFFGGIQKDATREAKGGYNVKVEKTESPMEGVRDIFEPVETTLAEIWRMQRPDLFTAEGAEAK